MLHCCVDSIDESSGFGARGRSPLPTVRPGSVFGDGLRAGARPGACLRLVASDGRCVKSMLAPCPR